MHNEQAMMTSPELASFLRVEKQTIRVWRLRGIGPRYVRVGHTKVLYRRADVEEWLKARTFASTSDETVAAGAEA